MRPASTITCPSCGGTAHLVLEVPDDLEPGTPVPYRCADCQERFDIVHAADEDDPRDYP
jgi:predicted nucleic acid-binding Zn ribbon protein